MPRLYNSAEQADAPEDADNGGEAEGNNDTEDEGNDRHDETVLHQGMRATKLMVACINLALQELLPYSHTTTDRCILHCLEELR